MAILSLTDVTLRQLREYGEGVFQANSKVGRCTCCSLTPRPRTFAVDSALDFNSLN